MVCLSPTSKKIPAFYEVQGFTMHLGNCLDKSGTDRRVDNHWKANLNIQWWLRNILKWEPFLVDKNPSSSKNRLKIMQEKRS